MNKEKLGDQIALAVVVALALITAYVCFGLLKSEANLNTTYSLSGAIAGAIISFWVYNTAYKQMRSSSDELKTLRQKNTELERKLIRGAPCPRNFEIEVDDRRRIVLAKPRTWKPGGGVLFNFESFLPSRTSGDTIPAQFTVVNLPISDGEAQGGADRGEKGAKQPKLTSDAANYYENFIKNTRNNPYVISYADERIFLGGEADNVECLKVIGRQYVRITLDRDPVTGIERYSWMPLTKDQYEEEKKLLTKEKERRAKGELPPQKEATTEQEFEAEDKSETEGDAETEDESKAEEGTTPAVAHTDKNAERSLPSYRQITRMTVLCHHPGLRQVFMFDFTDDSKDFSESSTIFNKILNSVRFLT